MKISDCLPFVMSWPVCMKKQRRTQKTPEETTNGELICIDNASWAFFMACRHWLFQTLTGDVAGGCRNTNLSC